MSSSTETISAQGAVELVLSNRVATEPGFLERLVLDPAGAVAEAVAGVADRDDIDLSGIAVSVHVQTPTSLHFVVSVNPESEEVAGFSMDPMRAFALDFGVRRPVFGVRAASGDSGTDTPCHTDACKSREVGSCPSSDYC
jgi:hypothetical protein